jgi:NTP pyrophosphatase (non-canonical NTP hydrolase)
MTLDELKKFAAEEKERLEKHFPIADKEKAIFARITKIMEELGELSEAVLSYYSLQRKDKKQKGKVDLERELADTMIGLVLLAEQTGIDIEKALREKIAIIRTRKY